MERTLDKEMQIFNSYEQNKGTMKVSANDNLSWNYLHALQSTKQSTEDQQDDTVMSESVKAFTEDQENLWEIQY